MGLPARKLGATARGAGRERTSRLRLVSPPQCARRTASDAAEAACLSVFRMTVMALVAFTALGLMRVTLSAKAAEAAVDQLRLERSIKAENRVADRLELDRSLLVTPSRIESVAAGLRMTKAPAVRYIPVPDVAVQPVKTAPRQEETTAEVSTRAAGRTLAGVLGAALDVTQKEARTLLVGDVGVAASR